jgi:hypothetical protein
MTPADDSPAALRRRIERQTGIIEALQAGYELSPEQHAYLHDARLDDLRAARERDQTALAEAQQRIDRLQQRLVQKQQEAAQREVEVIRYTKPVSAQKFDRITARHRNEVERHLRDKTELRRENANLAWRLQRLVEQPHPAETLPRLLQIAQAVAQQLNDPPAEA